MAFKIYIAGLIGMLVGGEIGHRLVPDWPWATYPVVLFLWSLGFLVYFHRSPKRPAIPGKLLHEVQLHARVRYVEITEGGVQVLVDTISPRSADDNKAVLPCIGVLMGNYCLLSGQGVEQSLDELQGACLFYLRNKRPLENASPEGFSS